ncbi:MAG: ABC transporter permease [Geminicoccaceae bacterium]|nr:MAG: ABC transporter permease [Geminicoccaceae bacterium]
MTRTWWIERLAPWVFTLGLFLVWEVSCHVFDVPRFVLPPPSLVFQEMWYFRSAIWNNSLVTLWTTLAGFFMAVVFGLILGIAVGWSRTIYAALYPVMVGFNAIPKVAVVPILVLWFGIGEVPAILTAFLISFFPIVVNVATGLATMEPEMEDVLRALGAKKMDIMLKVGIPRSLPYFFASLKVAITLAFVGSVVSETVAANRGIGHMLLAAQANFEVPLVFGGLIALAVLGIGMYAIFAVLERRMTGWAFRSGLNNA